MRKKKGDIKRDNLDEKPKEKRKFRFEIKPSRLPKKVKEIIELEQPLFEMIRGGRSTLLKGSYRGKNDVYWDNMVELDINLSVYLDCVDYQWYVDSKVLSYIYDCACIKTPPDYELKGVTDSYSEPIDKLFKIFKQYSTDQFGMTRIRKDKFIGICEWFVVFLTRAYRLGHLGLKYTRTRYFRSEHNVQNENFSHSVLLRFIDMLVAKGWVLNYTGNKMYGQKPMSLIVYNPVLIDILGLEKIDCEISTSPKDLVVVGKGRRKDKTYELVNVETLDDEMKEIVEETTEVLNVYHKCTDNTKIRIDGFEIPEIRLQRVLNVHKKTCGRFFDNSSIQGKSKEVRRFISMDGDNTVSLDFSSIHPAILLYWEGVKLEDHNPYPVLDSIEVDTKVIRKFKRFYDIDEYDPVRNIVKKLFLSLINASSVQGAVGSCYEELHKDSLKKGTLHEHTMKYIGLPALNLYDVASEILQHNKVISKYLGVGIGNKLQFMDSSIIQFCLNILSLEEIPCVPIHDALICKVVDKERVLSVMTEAFISVVGEDSENNCVIKEE